MKVKFIGHGILRDEQGNEYSDCGAIPGTLMCGSTGELFRVTKRDENEIPIEIEPDL